MINLCRSLSASTLALCASVSLGQTITVNYDQPAIDRWNYPFDSSPGYSDACATFSALGEEDAFAPTYTFDQRDSQAVFAWDTISSVPVLKGACQYTVTSAVITLGLLGDPPFVYDPTYDARSTYVTGGVDTDPGRPVELYGVGFRGGWTDGAPTQSNCPVAGGYPCYYEGDIDTVGPAFGPCICKDQRYVYPTDAIAGNLRDISNNVRDGFDPKPFAVGQIPGLSAGATPAPNTDMVFTLNVADSDVQAYLQSALNRGRLMVCVSSLQPASSPGGPGTGSYAKFYCKENPFAYSPGAGGYNRRARLSLTVQVTQLAGDFNNDGRVNTVDLALLLAHFGQSSTVGDANCDGVVSTADLGILLSNFGHSAP